MMDGIFRKEDLVKCDWQYQVRLHSFEDFVLNEDVFLKSNPEHPMSILKRDGNDIVCGWHDKKGKYHTHWFTPESILPYKYSCLVVGKGKFNVCLN
jgi:hypothetical protein